VTNTSDGASGSKTATARSNTATVTVNERIPAQTPNITQEPQSRTVFTGEVVTLSVTASVSDGGRLTYQWYDSDGRAISGANLSSYAPDTSTPGVYGYYVVVTNTSDGASGSKTATNTSRTATVTVNEPPAEPIAVTGVILHGESEVDVGDSITMTAEILPANADNKNVSWSSSNEQVASVSNGIVIGQTAGMAIITVTTEDGGYSDGISVTVHATETLTLVTMTCQCGPSANCCANNTFITDSMTVSDKYKTFTTEFGIKAQVKISSDGCVYVIAGVNMLGWLNAESTAAAVAQASCLARMRRQETLPIFAPKETDITFVSFLSVKWLVKARKGVDLVLAERMTEEDGTISRIRIPLDEDTGIILPGMRFNNTRIDNLVEYTAKNFRSSDILGAFMTAQPFDWGVKTKVWVSLEKLGIEAEDGDHLYLLHYDIYSDKWYQITAVVNNGFLVYKTKFAGVFTVIAEKVN
jgi:hypothetical protein